jgi:hypothetical protein
MCHAHPSFRSASGLRPSIGERYFSPRSHRKVNPGGVSPGSSLLPFGGFNLLRAPHRELPLPAPPFPMKPA